MNSLMASGRNVLVYATVTSVGDGPFVYPACSACYCKLIKTPKLEIACDKCRLTFKLTDVCYRYRFCATITEQHCQANMTAFGGMMNVFFGVSASDFHKRYIMTLQEKFGSAGDIFLQSALDHIFNGQNLIFGFKMPPKHCSKVEVEGNINHPSEALSLKHVVESISTQKAADGGFQYLIATQVLLQNSSTFHCTVSQYLDHCLSCFENEKINPLSKRSLTLSPFVAQLNYCMRNDRKNCIASQILKENIQNQYCENEKFSPLMSQKPWISPELGCYNENLVDISEKGSLHLSCSFSSLPSQKSDLNREMVLETDNMSDSFMRHSQQDINYCSKLDECIKENICCKRDEIICHCIKSPSIRSKFRLDMITNNENSKRHEIDRNAESKFEMNFKVSNLCKDGVSNMTWSRRVYFWKLRESRIKPLGNSVEKKKKGKVIKRLQLTYDTESESFCGKSSPSPTSDCHSSLTFAKSDERNDHSSYKLSSQESGFPVSQIKQGYHQNSLFFSHNKLKDETLPAAAKEHFLSINTSLPDQEKSNGPLLYSNSKFPFDREYKLLCERETFSQKFEEIPDSEELSLFLAGKCEQNSVTEKELKERHSYEHRIMNSETEKSGTCMSIGDCLSERNASTQLMEKIQSPINNFGTKDDFHNPLKSDESGRNWSQHAISGSLGESQDLFIFQESRTSLSPTEIHFYKSMHSLPFQARQDHEYSMKKLLFEAGGLLFRKLRSTFAVEKYLDSDEEALDHTPKGRLRSQVEPYLSRRNQRALNVQSISLESYPDLPDCGSSLRDNCLYGPDRNTKEQDQKTWYEDDSIDLFSQSPSILSPNLKRESKLFQSCCSFSGNGAPEKKRALLKGMSKGESSEKNDPCIANSETVKGKKFRLELEDGSPDLFSPVQSSDMLLYPLACSETIPLTSSQPKVCSPERDYDNTSSPDLFS